MKKLKEKGITLVALVITIIVMLILVGVTVNVAVQSGLFDETRKASSDTKMEMEKEMLISAALGAVDQNGYVDFAVLDNKLPSEFTKIGNRTYKSANGNRFNVNQNGEVALLEEEINEYGLYYNVDYVADYIGSWNGEDTDGNIYLSIDDNNNTRVISWGDTNLNEGSSFSYLSDGFGGTITTQPGGNESLAVSSIELGKEYYGYNSLGIQVTVWFDSDGDLYNSFSLPGAYITIDKSLRKINFANVIEATYSEDGKTITMGAYTYIADI